ncbi:MAG TPA: hypothetical protein VII47_10150 [Actinomycetota bacterium]
MIGLQLSFGFEMTAGFEMRASPELVTCMHMLAMSGTELERVIAEKLAENPALELDELHPRDVTERVGAEPLVPVPPGADRTDPRPSVVPFPATATDPLSLAGQQMSPAEQLLSDVAAVIPQADRPVAAYLIGSLDDHGMLDVSPADAARALEVDVAKVVDVLRAIRAVGPPGIAAASVRESLLLQLERLKGSGGSAAPLPHVRMIVSDHLDDLAAGRYRRIARALRIPEAEVHAAQAYIRRCLRPRPVVDFVARAPGLACDHGPALADVVIRSGEGHELEVEVSESRWWELRISRRYEELAAELAALRVKDRGPEPAAPLTAAERSHVEAHLEQARVFLQQLRQRGETLRRVAASLVERQRDFVLKGPLFLRPLTLAQVAGDLGFHESTVSRATSNKCAELPCGRIIPLRQFFEPARRTHELLRQLIAAETHPLSDDALARALAAQGVDVARRTVAKYRAELGIPPCHVRAALARASA